MLSATTFTALELALEASTAHVAAAAGCEPPALAAWTRCTAPRRRAAAAVGFQPFAPALPLPRPSAGATLEAATARPPYFGRGGLVLSSAGAQRVARGTFSLSTDGDAGGRDSLEAENFCCLPCLVGRMSQSVGQVAVVGEHQKTFRVLVQSAGAEKPSFRKLLGQQIENGFFFRWVIVRANVSCRFTLSQQRSRLSCSTN